MSNLSWNYKYSIRVSPKSFPLSLHIQRYHSGGMSVYFNKGVKTKNKQKKPQLPKSLILIYLPLHIHFHAPTWLQIHVKDPEPQFHTTSSVWHQVRLSPFFSLKELIRLENFLKSPAWRRVQCPPTPHSHQPTMHLCQTAGAPSRHPQACQLSRAELGRPQDCAVTGIPPASQSKLPGLGNNREPGCGLGPGPGSELSPAHPH